MNTDAMPPIAHRLMRASLKPAPQSFFWGLSTGFIIMVFPNQWVQVVGALLYFMAVAWFSLCFMARRDLQPEPVRDHAAELKATMAELDAHIVATLRKVERNHGAEAIQEPANRCVNLVSHNIREVGGSCSWCHRTEHALVEAAIGGRAG